MSPEEVREGGVGGREGGVRGVEGGREGGREGMRERGREGLEGWREGGMEGGRRKGGRRKGGRKEKLGWKVSQEERGEEGEMQGEYYICQWKHYGISETRIVL